ncbi:MAG: 2-oxo-4-hydroxy-4-carboxy-5-ureidoimidazoline decarboxylase, partial [Gemmatimonadota bacterium]|nr:2-oxo-4-hydroxy-4-carboxy-5-ureidoimidazoline decarboxylase [Gemmatimonadota bacterium]
MTLEEFNAMPDVRAAGVFRACCGSSHWVNGMVRRRPFSSVEAMLNASDEEWQSTSQADWHEAFAHHPRIGDRTVSGWAGGEQARALSAEESLQEELAKVNQEYENHFGHMYIVCASGRTAEEMLIDARARINNDPATELRIAAAEQHK